MGKFKNKINGNGLLTAEDAKGIEEKTEHLETAGEKAHLLMEQEKKLRRLTDELYRDDQGTLYVYMKGFLARHGMPDSAESRAAVLEEIRKEFGEIAVVVLEKKPL